MTLDETIYLLRQEANEWDWLRSSTKDDEENGFKCRFSEASEEYARRVEEITQIANWLEELKTLRKAYNLICYSYVNDTEECNCPRELRERCKAQDYMSRHCSLNSIAAVKDYFLKEAKMNE